MTGTQNTCVVVGAGVSGLIAAGELAAAGWNVVVLDKGRGVGGRMATRRLGDGTFDHGAQFFTARSERFEGLVERWRRAGVVEVWTRGFADAEGKLADDGHPRYRGTRGMTSVPKHLSSGLDVRTDERVDRVALEGEAWEVHTASGTSIVGDAVLVTAPVPQSLALFDQGHGLPEVARRRLEMISYSPCFALLALLEGPTGVPEPGGVQVKGEPLDWIADNQRKGISQAPGITIHAGPEWSAEHFDADEAWISSTLLGFASEQLGADLSPNLAESSLARWRYSWVTQGDPERCFVAVYSPPLVFAGDAFGAPKVEGATLSGLAAADSLLGRQG